MVLHQIVGRIKNRKLRKLILRPKQYFFDIPELQPIFSALGIDPDAGRKVGVTGLATKPVPHKFTYPGLEECELIGNNWLENGPDAKPIAILIGFNPWKRDFVSRYLREYRTAYPHSSMSWETQDCPLNQHSDLAFIVWGMSESDAVNAYVSAINRPLYRMEDGFIRSASLGSQHTTALSLVLDKSGLYFDAGRPSDLETILATHNFDKSPDLLEAARSLMELIRTFRISKYNLSAFHEAANLLGERKQKRILVLGQVEGDASIRYGNASDWNNQRLIELAIAENPAAQIIYKPHPDVIKGFRANASSLSSLSQLCFVLLEDVVLGDLFGEVDHVYTITSLSGFEALIYGLPVTVVGMPFYAGWGLTDDRQSSDRRQRKLSMDQLFCGAYLLYPRYLPDLDQPETGALGAILKILADTSVQNTHLVRPENLWEFVSLPSPPKLWSLGFSPHHVQVLKKSNSKNTARVPFEAIMEKSAGEQYRCSLAYLFVGIFHNSAQVERVWAAAQKYLSELDFSQLREDFQTLTLSPPSAGFAEIYRPALEAIDHRRLDEARKSLNNLLLMGHAKSGVFDALSQIAQLQFDFASAASFLAFCNTILPGWKKGNSSLAEAEAQNFVSQTNAAIYALASACLHGPQNVAKATNFEAAFKRKYPGLSLTRGLYGATSVEDKADRLAQALALISLEEPELAEARLANFRPKLEDREVYLLRLSLALSYQGANGLSKAKSLITSELEKNPSSSRLIQEGMRLAIVLGDYAWGGNLLEAAAAHEIEVNDIYLRKLHLGLNNIQQSYASFRRIRISRVVAAYLNEKYVQTISELSNRPDTTNLIVSLFGPGDEIRFASMYPAICSHLTAGRVVFTCDPRLLTLLQRSMPQLNFAPVTRARNLFWVKDGGAQYQELPGSDLHPCFDNAGWALAERADKVALVTDLLADVIAGYESFSGHAYLNADPGKCRSWEGRLRRGSGEKTLFVGLSWRSGVVSYARNEHYVSIEALAPIFELENICFVNLQYDKCDEELAWARKHFPGKLLNFEDLDQFNDLDNVAALMTCLDLVISPATTVVELAGALGCETLLLSNSSELHWRKLPGTCMDVWHRSITHIEGNALGDKSALIHALRKHLGAHLSAAVDRA